MLQYLAFRILSLLAPLAPPGVGYWLCDRVGDILFSLLPNRRATVLRNLSFVIGHHPADAAKLARATFREGVRYYYDTFRAPGLSGDDIESLIHFEGLEHLDEALARGQGGIIVTAHFGSPALVVQLVALRGYKITTVVEPVKPQKLFDLINGVRGCRGIRLLPLAPSNFRDLTAALRRNEVVGILADRDLQGTGSEVLMFGGATRLPAGPAMLSLRTGAPMLPTFGVRGEDNRFHGTMERPIETVRTGDLKEDIRLNTQRVAEVLEKAISKRPEQWIVFEPIWPERTLGSAESST